MNPTSKKKEETFITKELGGEQAYTICNHLGRFLQWINDYKGSDYVRLTTHTALPNGIINEYINKYLIDECESGEAVSQQAVNALTAYYHWLFYFFDNRRKYIGVESAYRAVARNNNKGVKAVKYLLPQTRQILYQNTKSLLQEVVLRNGGELGCRTKENTGFLLHDFKVNKETYSGLLTLFEQLESHPNQEEFKYYLSSLYTKYGRSRMLYIPRGLLEKMKKYYELERPRSSSNHLLLANSGNAKGKCISSAFGSNTFLEVRRKVLEKINAGHPRYANIQEITECNTYHHLRHSFGTDIFYNLCEGQNKHYETITTTSGVYLETARRLGHQVEGLHAGETTKRYIHSCCYRECLLKEVVNG
ncbi:site-specific integrase [Thalassotalea loyana]|nr:site-specific integrase [Thalassotalea loyana]